MIYLIPSVHGKLAVQHQKQTEMQVKCLAGVVLFCKPQSKEVESSLTSHICNRKGAAEKPSASKQGLQFCLLIFFVGHRTTYVPLKETLLFQMACKERHEQMPEGRHVDLGEKKKNKKKITHFFSNKPGTVMLNVNENSNQIQCTISGNIF